MLRMGHSTKVCVPFDVSFMEDTIRGAVGLYSISVPAASNLIAGSAACNCSCSFTVGFGIFT